jgi:hypothetical protein
VWIFAAQVPDGLLYGIVPIIFSALFAWGAWVTLHASRTEAQADSATADIADHETRLRALEARR